MNIKHRFFAQFKDYLATHAHVLTLMILVLFLPLIYMLVYFTGGIKYVYSHTMYIPILLAGILIGPKSGFMVALIAGILLGPLMPIDTETGEMQETFNWLYRLITFMLIGIISGIASKKIKDDGKAIQNLMSHNQETHIPNTNYLSYAESHLNDGPFTISTLMIHNHYNIKDVLGVEIYHLMLFELFKDLKENLSQPNLVIQSDSHKLWVILPFNNLLEDTLCILDIISRQRQVKNIPLYIDFSIGTSSCSTTHELTKLSTFENCDLACRHAQTNNLPYAIFDLSKQRLKTEYALLSTFLYALENHQTFLVFQPKIDLKTKRTIGLEALIRWQHPERGLIPPDVFIPLIEETKLIHILTDWVLEETLKFISTLISTHQEVPISVNVSAKNLFDPQFYNRFMSIMRKHQVSTSLIHIEITESTLMMQPDESKIILQKFRNEGIKVELDDFGKGYSSLAYLAQFPIDTIKIDRFFMQNIVDDFAIQEIVRATIGLSKKLGYHVLAEGVETITVEDLLIDLGCDYAQGYLYEKPLSQDELIIWLKNHTIQS